MPSQYQEKRNYNNAIELFSHERILECHVGEFIVDVVTVPRIAEEIVQESVELFPFVPQERISECDGDSEVVGSEPQERVQQRPAEHIVDVCFCSFRGRGDDAGAGVGT